MHQHIQQINERKSGLLSYLLLLTVFFILLEISFFIQSSDIYLSDVNLVADHFKIPGKVIPGILYFLFIQLFLHFLFTFFIWAMVRLVGVALNCSWKVTEKLGFVLWFIGIATVLLMNQFYFPNSKFSHLVGTIIPPVLGKWIWIPCLSSLAIAACISFWGLIVISSKKTKIFIASLAVMGLIGYSVHQFNQPVVTDAATPEKPNIILIGIDSLRPDFLGYFGYEKHTPHLDHFLNQSAVFSDAFTPIARTFPAWVSILTGQYPKKSGVRFNLPTLGQFNWENTLPNKLRHEGYETIFATDETRFSNIDQSFGFNKVVTPPTGFNDFLLGNLNDFPIANLLVNTPIGKYLFPHSYGNRPVITTYDPNSFLNFLTPTLAESRTKPIFLAIHFCLPHYPYSWGTVTAGNKSLRNYQAAIHRVDQQFQDFLQLLQHNKLLERSIVVVLSDHGEAIELAGDRVTEKDLFIPGNDNKQGIIPRFYPPSFDFEEVNQSAGHGTDVLGLTQYHVVLAFKTYGLVKNRMAPIAGRVSLLDIKPTVLDFVHHPHETQNDGISLKNSIISSSALVPHQHFFIESDYSPQAIRSVHPETRKILFEGIEFFQVDPVTAHITVKDSMAKLIVSSKQYANISGEWILALYPQSTVKMMPILVNLQSGLWTNDLQTAFALASPAKSMLKEMERFYGKDITSVLTVPSTSMSPVYISRGT